MARAKGKPTGKDHSRVNLAIWGDENWMDLTPAAQHLYFVLWTSPQLTYCGSATWHPGRIAAKAHGWTAAAVEAAAAELSRQLFLIVDTDTEEYLLRSWIKHDGLCKQPNLTVSMANARASLASRTLRGVVVHEVAKIKARNIEDAKNSDETGETLWGGWQRDEVKQMLAQKAIDPATLPPFTPTATPRVTPDLTPGETPRFTPQLRVTPGVGVNPPPDPPHTPSPTPATTSILQRGQVSGVPHQSTEHDPNTPPFPRCPDHRNEPSTKPCGACGDHRRIRNDWDLAQAAAKAQAITDCTRCDDAGWELADDGTTAQPARRCTHSQVPAAAHA